jgi:aminoglycoside phosphotransferase (APT) family kinase protein
MAGDPPGLALDRLGAYLAGALAGGTAGPLAAELIAGGRSNLTYRVGDGVHRWVLRRPPLGHVLPTAHDMSREYRVIRALRDTPVPVPEALLLCTDESVLGAPFYLMSEVDGVVLRRAAQYGRLTAAQAAGCGRLLVDTLVALHGVAPEAVGLADFGRPDGYLTRQVGRWYRQWNAAATRPLAALDELYAGLAAAVPDSARYGIVHGDYRLDNLMFAPDLDRVAAVLDWEMATLGDPLADVGLLYVYRELSGRGMPGPSDPLPAGLGFPSAADLLTGYAERTGRPAASLDWYVALGYYKLAIISEGIHARYLAGETVGAGFDTIGERVPGLVDLGISALAEGI